LKFRKCTPIFDKPFVFRKNDYEQFVRQECYEVRNLLFAYGIKIKEVDLDLIEEELWEQDDG